MTIIEVIIYCTMLSMHQSLDLAIEAIGKGKFQKALAAFQQVKAYANAHCEYKSPCIGEGKYRSRRGNQVLF